MKNGEYYELIIREGPKISICSIFRMDLKESYDFFLHFLSCKIPLAVLNFGNESCPRADGVRFSIGYLPVWLNCLLRYPLVRQMLGKGNHPLDDSSPLAIL